MPFSINDFKNKVQTGVRPNLFRISMTPIVESGFTNGANDELITFLCKSAALPSSTMGTIEVPFRGRNLKIPGDRTFDSWTATFINDPEFKVRATFESWLNTMNKLSSNTGTLTPSAIFKDITIQQLSKTSIATASNQTGNAGGASDDGVSVIRTYILKDAWPSSVSQIALGYDQNDQIEEFDVEFQYQYFEVRDGVPSGIN